MKRFLKWSGIALLAIAILATGLLLFNRQLLNTPLTLASQAQQQTDSTALQTVKIQPAANVLGRVSASGKIGLLETDYIVMDVGGTVREVNAKVGDVVKAGDPLLSLETVDLQRAARKAELNVAAAKNSLAQLQQPASEMEIAAAQADLLAAQQKLEDAQKPASETELSAARASVNSAWAKYNELLAPKSAAEITKLEANLRKAEIALAEKQRAYDKVKWRNDIGMTVEAADLQQATIDYETAKADYEVTTKAADKSELQSALSNAKNAEKQLDDLLAKPDKAEIASAEAQAATAQQKLDDLKKGKDALEIEAAQIKLDQALVDLEEAYTNLTKAQLTAPVGGVVLTLTPEKGQRIASGAIVATIADTTQLEVAADVAEVDIDQIDLGQQADVTVDALPGQSFRGVVERISPRSSSESGVVNYQVTILLDQGALQGLRPDMTAVAKMTKNEVISGWLVPTTSITQESGKSTITIVRNGEQQQVAVSTGEVQGEWTVVEAPELEQGDSVVGSVTTYINDTNNTGFAPGRSGLPPGMRP